MFLQQVQKYAGMLAARATADAKCLRCSHLTESEPKLSKQSARGFASSPEISNIRQRSRNGILAHTYTDRADILRGE